MKFNPSCCQLAADDRCFISNPFATRFVRPGCLAWVSSANNTVATLAARFQSEHRSQAAIVGPHGSGKSTLLAQLVPLLGEVVWHQTSDQREGLLKPGGKIVWLGLRRASQRPLHQVMVTRKFWGQHGLLVLDGLEQLRPWEALCVRFIQRAAGMGLLATCHRRSQMPVLRLPMLISTDANVETVQRLVAQRLSSTGGLSPNLIDELTQIQLIKRLLVEERGSVREVFMRMYDLVENRRLSSDLSNSCPASVSKINHTISRLCS